MVVALHVAELSEGNFRRRGCSWVARLTVKPQEGHDVHAGWQCQQTLLEQPQEIFVAGLHALGFGFFNLADGHEVL